MRRGMDEIKERILNRLYDSAGVCDHCGKKHCPHSNRKLPDLLKVEDVLRAINLGEYYLREHPLSVEVL